MSSAATNGRLVVVTHPSGNRIDYVWAENNRYGQITSITMNPANSNGVGTNTASTVPLLSGIEYTGLGQAKRWKWGKHSAASTSTAQPTLDHSFTYDATGNRTSQSLNGTTFTHTVSATSNKLTQVAGPTAYTPVYDAMGNLTSNGTATFTYSDRGRLKTALVGTNSIAYLYNALEQRVRKSGPSTIIPSGQALYAYDEQGQLLGDYTSTNIANYETVYLGSMPVAVFTQTRTGTSPNFTFATTVNYAYADQIDTVRVITRASDNKMRWRWDAADP